MLNQIIIQSLLLNKMDLEIAKNLVFSSLEGKATPMQKKLIEDWLACPENMEQYFKWLDEWERINPQFLPDTARAYEKFLSKIHTYSTESKFNIQAHHLYKSKSYRLPIGFGIAACFILLIGIVSLFFKDQIFYTIHQTHYGEIKSLTLPDKSVVVLNANSMLRIPRWGFGKHTREVFLQGEAEFSVTHTTDNQRFIVNTPDKVKVEVLGTEFVVYSRNRGTKIALHKGKVQLHSLKEENKQKIIEMKVGDIVTVDKKGTFRLQPSKNTFTIGSKAWKEHTFIFESTSLEEITYQIEENFGVKVQIADRALAVREISGDYQAANAEELLRAIAEVLGAEVEVNNKRLRIKPTE